jgi:CRISPR/Cas system CSM-associated protein Csm3 (group 7 of RAMP superfamily)
MLKQALHEFEAKLILTAVSPLLIKDGRVNDDSRKEWESDKDKRKKMPVAIPISRNTDDQVRLAVTDRYDPMAKVAALDFYLPGSSLKGSWRSHLERTLRGLTPESEARICDPLDADGIDVDQVKSGRCSACSAVLELKKKQYSKDKKAWFPAYAMSCPICRMFGSTVMASRVKISDGVRHVNGKLVLRESVAINRKSGQVAGPPLKFFALQDAKFNVTLTLRNYELYQLLLVGVLLSDLMGMRILLGSGKSKGYGQIKAEIQSLALAAFSLQEPPGTLAGLAEHLGVGHDMQQPYRVRASEPPPQLPARKWQQDKLAPWRWQFALGPAEFFALMPAIKLNLGATPNLSQRLEWKPGQEPAWQA